MTTNGELLKQGYHVNVEDAVELQEVKSITVIGKRWFQRTYGNTYNSVQIMVNGETVATLPEGYGYGSMYLQRATQWLDAHGYVTLEHYEHGGMTPLWQYCRDNDIHLEDTVIDVPRERDL